MFSPVLRLAVGSGLVTAGYIALHVPLFQALAYFQIIPVWFWYFSSNSWGGIGCLAALLALAALLVMLSTGNHRLGHATTVAAMVVIGASLQFCFAWLEGRNLDGLRDRVIIAGHSEFVDAAVRQHDAGQVLRNYEQLAESGHLGRFSPSKPPGTLLFYMATEAIANAISPLPATDLEERGKRLRDVITFFWPAVAALAVVPLYYLCLIWLAPAGARLAAGLYLATPSFELVTLHTDQVLFPLLFNGCLWLSSIVFARALAGRRAAEPSLAFGAAVYLAAFFQLPLILAAVPYGVTLVIFAWREWRGSIRGWWQPLVALAAAPAIGALSMTALFWGVWGYDPIQRYFAAAAYHRAWYHWAPAMRINGAIGNLLEISVWAGPALMTLFAAAIAAAWRQVIGRSNAGAEGLILGTALIMIWLMFLGNTIAEVARLWIFVIPSICLAAAWYLTSCLRQPAFSASAAVLMTQLICVYVIKVRMDFH